MSEAPEQSGQPLKICLLGYRSNPYSGGQGVYIKFLSEALVNAGHSVDVISGPPYPDLDARVNLIKLPSLNLFEEENHVTALKPHHLLSYTDFFEWFSMLTGGFAEPYTFGRRLVKHFRDVRPDYDIVHDNQSLCYGTLQLQRDGIPLLTTIHHPITSDLEIALQSADTWGLRLLIKRWHSFLRMQKKVVKSLDNIVTVSKVSRDDIAAAFNINADNIDVVHNGIATDMFAPAPVSKAELMSVMATASADAPLKGLSYLLKAVALLKAEGININLILLGKLKPGGDTEKLINDLGIGEQIEFHSGLSSEEVAALYHRASIAVVPSVYEGFGLPAGEAMACGLPVISTDGGALPEVVGDAGVIVPTRDERAIAAAIKSLLDDPDRRSDLGHRARQRILESFSWEVAARDMTTLYRNIIAANQTARAA